MRFFELPTFARAIDQKRKFAPRCGIIIRRKALHKPSHLNLKYLAGPARRSKLPGRGLTIACQTLSGD
jgi:hypothetical protein